MRGVKVQYTVREEYAETNKRNIAAVMSELRTLDDDSIRYSAHTLDDGRTFVHIAFYKNENGSAIVNGLESFKRFQAQLKESKPEVPPQVEDLHLVASAYDIF